MSAASLSINHYRWRTDAGTIDGTPTFGAAVDTAWSIADATGFMIVFCVTNSGTTASSSTTVKLQVSKNSGAFTDVTTSSVTAITADVSSSADQTAVAVSEVTGTGSFVSGKYSEIGTTAAGVTIAGSSYTNFVYGVKLNPGQLFNRDTLQFKIVTVAGTSITATTIPTITFTGGYVALDAQILFPNPQNRLLASAHIALRAQDETWVATNTTLLQGQDRIYGGVGQVADYDWTNPQNRLSASAQVALRADAEAGGLNLALLASLAVTYEPQAPIILAGWAARRSTPDHVVSLSLALQAIPPDTTNTTRSPVFLRGWPASASIELRTWIRSSPIHLPVSAPFPSPVWPNPGRVRDALTAQIQPHRVTFSGLDTVYGAPGQVPTQAFANPRGPQYPVALRGFVTTSVTPAAAEPAVIYTVRAPVFSFSWTPYRPPSQPLQQNLLMTLLGVPVAAPFQPIVWTNPRGVRWQPQPEPTPSVFAGPPPEMGRNQYSWPNPSFKTRGPSMAVMAGNVVYVPVVTPPDTGQRHNLPFWATPGRLRSF